MRKLGFSKTEAETMKAVVRSYKFHRETEALLVKVILNNAKELDDFDATALAKFHCEECINSRPNP